MCLALFKALMNKIKSLPSWNGILFGVLFHGIQFDIYY